jgi:hypothetical protein
MSLSNLSEYFDPTKYHKHSKVYKAQKSPSAPSTPQNEYFDEKVSHAGKTKRRKKEKRKQDEIFITSQWPSRVCQAHPRVQAHLYFVQCTWLRSCRDKTSFSDSRGR